MKSFKTILLESKQTDELRKFIINSLGKDVINRSTNSGFYIDGSKYMNKTNDGYETTTSSAIKLNKEIIRFNSTHNYKIDWNQPDNNKNEIYIKIKRS